MESRTYSDALEQQPNRALHLPPSARLTGSERYQRLRENLVAALGDERILLVLDNFEPTLAKRSGKDGYPANDPEWDKLLAWLAAELPLTQSRLLMTSRHRPAALSGQCHVVLWLPLGPLPLSEAALYLHGRASLRGLFHGTVAEQKLARRLLEVSRGHPLILQRLGDLADRGQAYLEMALERIQGKGFRELPDLFAPITNDADRQRQHAYLEDVAMGAVDLLIERLSPKARELLWVVTQALEPLPEYVIEAVWLSSASESGALAPLLAELHDSGLLSREATAHSAVTTYLFHELVRERAAAWVESHLGDSGGRSQTEVWKALGQHYGELSGALMTTNREGARQQALEAGRRGLTYLCRARDFDAMGSFVSIVVGGTHDPSMLRPLVAELEAVADQVPAGKAHWCFCTYLADALDNSGQPERSLPLYEQAVTEAEAAGDWPDVGWITGNWAAALTAMCNLPAARDMHLKSAEAERRAGRPASHFVGSELEALRIDVMQGKAKDALTQIKAHLAAVRGWWQRQQAGESVPEAPNVVFLGRVLVGALDIADDANRALERWEACLDLLTECEEVKRTLGEPEHEVARTRYNRCGPLLRLGRLEETEALLKDCLEVFRQVHDHAMQSNVLSALADLRDKRGDPGQAAAIERQSLRIAERFADPISRAISHGNLSNYLGRINQLEESARHWLASFVYFHAAGHWQHLMTAIRNLGNDKRRAAAEGRQHELPRLAELLVRPEFTALARFLHDKGIEPADMQAQVDESLSKLEN